RLNMVVRERDEAMKGISSIREKGGELLAELEVLYPQVTQVAYSQTLGFTTGRPVPDTLALIVVTTKGKDLSNKEKELVEKWLSTRLKSDSLMVLFNK
ncbi:MAG: hypothetical protein R2758_17350, partial [Bacteroidales bacterium]